jgi:hypothetical protein
VRKRVGSPDVRVLAKGCRVERRDRSSASGTPDVLANAATSAALDGAITAEIGDLAVLPPEGQVVRDVRDPTGEDGQLQLGMADLPRNERQNTAYPPQTGHSQNPRRFGQLPPLCRPFSCKILVHRRFEAPRNRQTSGSVH